MFNPTLAKGSDELVDGVTKKFAIFSVCGLVVTLDVGVKFRLRVPILASGLFTVVFKDGDVAAGTRRAGESRLNVPEAPSKGLLYALPRGFDIFSNK